MNENIKAGAEIHACDGDYSIGTQEGYEAFARERNKSLFKMRIRELWDMAAKMESDPSWEGQTRFMEKFAELIVRECVSHVADDNNAFDILKQFGVE